MYDYCYIWIFMNIELSISIYYRSIECIYQYIILTKKLNDASKIEIKIQFIIRVKIKFDFFLDVQTNNSTMSKLNIKIRTIIKIKMQI